MFQEQYEAVANAAAAKVRLMKENPLGYFLLSMLAGMYVGFGILLIFSIGGLLIDQPYARVVMGASFGIALSLVIIAGGELFTGNNLVMAAGIVMKKVTIAEACILWVVCFLGNLAGSIVLAWLYHVSQLGTGTIGEFIATSAQTKMSIPFLPLFTRGILCNILVCLAIWCGFLCKSESGKLILVFWCLFAFITSGFEHSVANMTLLTIALLQPFGTLVSISGYFYNLLVVTAGNMVGGILYVALSYYFASTGIVNRKNKR